MDRYQFRCTGSKRKNLCLYLFFSDDVYTSSLSVKALTRTVTKATFPPFSTHAISVLAGPSSLLCLSMHHKGQRSKEPARVLLLPPQLAVAPSSKRSTMEKNLAQFYLMLFCSCKLAVVQQRYHSKTPHCSAAFPVQLITWEIRERNLLGICVYIILQP